MAQFSTDSPVLDVVFSPSKQLLAVGTYNGLSLFDLAASNGTPLWSHGITAHSVEFLQDDENMIIGGFNRAEIWNRAQSKEACRLFHQTNAVVGNLALSSECNRLVSASRNEIKFWDLEQVTTTKETEGDIWGFIALDVAADGTRIATGTVENDVKIWNPSSGEEVRLKGHEGHVRSVDFSHSGAEILLTSVDTVAQGLR